MSLRKNIEVIEDENDYQCFKSTCGCCDNDHTVTVMIDHNQVELEFKMVDHDDYNENIFCRLLKRIMLALKILLTGRHTTYGEFIFKDSEHVENFVNTLKDARYKVTYNKKFED